jgi:hypothetical protein
LVMVAYSYSLVLLLDMQMAFSNATYIVQLCSHLVQCRSWDGHVQPW